MNHYLLKVTGILLLAACLNTPAVAEHQNSADHESARIRGVARFLLNRANQNFVYLFEKRLQTNKYFQCYFPNTYEITRQGNLNALLRNADEVWGDSVEKDIKQFYYRARSILLSQALNLGSSYINDLYKLIDNDVYVNKILKEHADPDKLNKLSETLTKLKEENLVANDGKEEGESCLNGVIAKEQHYLQEARNKIETRLNAKAQEARLAIADMEQKVDLGVQRIMEIAKNVQDIKNNVDAAVQFRKDVLKKERNENIKKFLLEVGSVQGEVYTDLATELAKTDPDTYGKITRTLDLELFGPVRDYVRNDGIKYTNGFSVSLDKIESFGSKSMQFRQLFDNLKDLKARANKLIKFYHDAKDQLEQKFTAAPDDVEYLKGFVQKIDAFDNKYKISKFIDNYSEVLASLDKIKEITNSDSNSIVKVIEVARIVKGGFDLGVVPYVKDFQNNISAYGSFSQFEKFAVFFAEVQDAKTEEQMVALLEEITLPPVSFGVKRNRGEKNWLITSYLGVVAGEENHSRSYGGIFAPVGIEWTPEEWKFSSGGSLSIMVAPLDFGHAVNLELQDSNQDLKFSDVIVPGVYLSYGWKNSPLTWGLGYARRKALRSDKPDEGSVMLFFAFDMPLFGLY